MRISYNKLWKLLIDKNMNKRDLKEATGVSSVLPYEDGAFLQSYRWLYKTDDCSPTSIKKKCSKWRPYSSTAARYMYRALDMGLTKKEFHLFKEV